MSDKTSDWDWPLHFQKPLLPHRGRSHTSGNQAASFHTSCAECNDMGIDMDNIDYQNYEGDLHAAVIDETQDEEHLRMRGIARNRSSRSKGSHPLSGARRAAHHVDE